MKVRSLLRLLYIIVIDLAENGVEGKDREIGPLLVSAYKDLDPDLRKKLNPELKTLVSDINSGREREASVVNFGHAIADVMHDIGQDSDFKRQDLELVKAAGLFYRADSEAAYKKLIRFAGHVHDSWIGQRLDQGHEKQDDSALRAIVKRLVGRDDNKLTTEEAAEMRVKKPEVYKEYLAHRRQHLQVAKDALASLVRNSGKPLIPMQEVYEYLQDNQIENSFPQGFTGLVDDIGRFYTNDGQPIEGVPNSHSFPKIKMNPNFGRKGADNWVFVALRPDGSTGPYFYTSSFKKARAASKFEKANLLGEKIDQIRKKWLAKIRNFDPDDPNSVVAVVLELIYSNSARIGSPGNKANNQPTYGISTLLTKHATIKPNNDIVLTYLGKDAVKTKHVVSASDPESRFVNKALHELIDGKAPSERIFTYFKGDKDVPITAAQVNAFFRSAGAPAGTTVHKLRTLKGTALFREALEKELQREKLPNTDSAAMALLKKMAMDVGRALNHVRRSADGAQSVTPTTALQNYIDPVVQQEYFDTLGLRAPKYLEKMLKTND